MRILSARLQKEKISAKWSNWACLYGAFGDYESFAELFADDGVLELGFTLVRKEKIRHSITKRPDDLCSLHVLTYIFIDVQTPNPATGISYLTLYRHQGLANLQIEPINEVLSLYKA